MATIVTRETGATAKGSPLTNAEVDQNFINLNENKLEKTDPRLSDAREWTAATVSQAEAEAGASTTRRAWTAQRVFQAAAAWWNSSSTKTKLDGIEAGAQVNTVSSVANKTGAVTLSKSDVGLGNVDNTSDANKPVSTAVQTALNNKENTIAAGTTSQYWRGDKLWRDFFTDVRSATLTGLNTATNAVVVASDTVLAALGKMQAQITSLGTSKQNTLVSGTNIKTVGGQSLLGSGDITVNANATKLQTARTLTIGNTGKGFDGSANVSWSLDEIGAASAGIISGSTDLNRLVKSGFYRIGNPVINAPTGVQNGQLIVSSGGDTIVQILAGPAGGEIYWRQGNPPDVGGPGSWFQWHKFFHSGNLGAASETASGIVKLATVADVLAGTDTIRAVTPNGLAAYAGALSFRNRIINGKMEISQRGTSFAAIAHTAYSLDRWVFANVTTAVITASQQADVPSDNKFQSSLRLAVTTANTSISSTEHCSISQHVEGYNVRDLIGCTFTLSFWVRSSKTGTHCVAFQNIGEDRSYLAEYSISSANTWEFKTVTVSGGLIVAGTWDWTNGLGLIVRFSLAAGSNFHTTAGAWQTGNFRATANQVNCLDTVGNIFAITGVQLEPGSYATQFEHRPYGVELALCQRYFWKSESDICVQGFTFSPGNSTYQTVSFPTRMRVTPTVTAIFASAIRAVGSISGLSPRGFQIKLTCSRTGMKSTEGGEYLITFTSSNSASAEL